MSQVIKSLELKSKQENSIYFCQISQLEDHSIAIRKGLLGTVGNLIFYKHNSKALADNKWKEIITTIKKEEYQTSCKEEIEYYEETNPILEDTINIF